MREARESHHLPEDQSVLFLEVSPGDVSDFTGTLKVVGADVGGFHVLRATSPAIPNAIAAVRTLGDQNGFLVDATEDPSVFTDSGLADYNAVSILLTTGDVLDES